MNGGPGHPRAKVGPDVPEQAGLQSTSRQGVTRSTKSESSIEWRWYNPETKVYERVYPKRFTYPDGSLVPEEF